MPGLAAHMDSLTRSSSLAVIGVAAALALGCGGSDLTLPNQELPAKIVVLGGDGQTAAAGGALPDSLLVRVTDSKDRPIQTTQVTFAPSAGTVVPTSATTNADGRAGAIWVLGPVAGAQTVTATASGSGAPAGLAVTFHATAITSAAARLDKAAGDGQTATAGAAVATPPAVKVSDKNGNPVAGVAVTFAVATGAGAVNPTTPIATNAAGIAAVTNWTLGTVAGPNTLTATIPLPGITGNPATFTATGTVGSAGKLAMVQQPSATAQSGVILAQQPKLQVEDASGNPVKTAGLAVTANVASGAGGTLGGQLTVATDANGVASFSGLALTGPVGTYTLGFTSPTLSGAASAAITLTAGAPTQLLIAQQPAPVAQSGTPLNPPPVVQLADAQGNPVAQALVNVTAALNVPPSPAGTLGGTKTVATDATGKATFANLTIRGPNGQYTLSFSSLAPALASGPSSPITLSAGAPAMLFLATPPSASVASGQVFPQQPAIQVQDGSGNSVAAPGIAVTVTITAGGGTLGGTPTAVTNGSGLATFVGLSLTGAIGPHQLTFRTTTPSLTATTANIALSAGGATQITRNSASPQSGSVGAKVPAPPSVLVRDANANPVAGVPVTFAVTSGGGSISPTTPILTDATGVATLTQWILGPNPGTNTVTASATGLAGSPVTFTATGVGVLTITSATPLPAGEVGVAYSTAITVAGGSAPYTWALSPGPLPGGLGLNAGTGVISGSPGGAVSGASFGIKVTDITSTTTTKAFALTILPAVTISTTSVPGGTVGVVYNQPLVAANGQAPYTWSLASGSPPAGVLLSAGGVLGGTPTAAGPFSFTVRVTDALGGTTTRHYSGSIVAAPSVTTTSLPNGEIGVAYSAGLTGTGGTPPYSWTVALGSLPNNLNLSAGGTVSGTPTLPAGTSAFTVQLTDAATATASKGLSIVVQPAVAITTTSLPSGAVGVAYSQTLATTGGQAPFTWALASGSPPNGLSLTAGGVVTGTPNSSAGSPFSFQVRVTDALGGTDTQTYVVSIASSPTITNTSPLPAGEAGVAYQGATLAATGGQPPYTFSVQSGSLNGLALNAGTGAITGTPASSGNLGIMFQVTDANTASSTKSLTIPVRTAVNITTASLPGGSVGNAYNQTMAANGGQAGFTWTLTGGAFPNGLGLSAGGVISGTPTAGGTFSGIVIQVTDALGGTDAQTYSITIGAANSTTTVGSSDASAVFGETVTFTANVTTGGGTPTGTVAFKDGSCAAGTTLDTETLSGGTATSSGITSLSVGNHSIRACYSGDSNFNPSNSGPLTQAVAKAQTSVSISDNPTSSVVGQAITVNFTVSVTAPGAGSPTGTVTVNDGTGASCNASVAAGSCQLTSTTAGTKTLVGTYSGDANFTTSASLGNSHPVSPANTATTVGSNNNPATFGDPVTFTATVSTSAPGSGTPDGSVDFFSGSCSGTELSGGAVPLSGGTASFQTNSLPGGGTTTTIAACYSGSADFNLSSGTVDETVN
jgi:hypothetical protein